MRLQKGLVYQIAHRLFSTCIECTRGRVVLTRKLCDIFYLHEYDDDLGTLALSYHELEHLRRRFHRVDLSKCIFPVSPEKNLEFQIFCSIRIPEKSHFFEWNRRGSSEARTECVNGHFWSNLCLNCIFKWT